MMVSIVLEAINAKAAPAFPTQTFLSSSSHPHMLPILAVVAKIMVDVNVFLATWLDMCVGMICRR